MEFTWLSRWQPQLHALLRIVTGLLFMQKRRSPQQMARYRANRLVLFGARLATIEYAAAAFAVVFLLK